MADIDRNIVLDQVNVDLILSPIGNQILNRTKNGRMLDDDQVHSMVNGFCHRLLPDIQGYHDLLDVFLQGADL